MITITSEIFDVVLRSPLGLKTGTLNLSQDGVVLHGTFSFFDRENPIEEVCVKNNTYSFCGNIATAVGEREYKATVSIIDDELSGELIFYLRTVPLKIPLLIPMKLTGKRKAVQKEIS